MNRQFTRHRQYDDAVFTELNWGALNFDWDENVVRVSIRDHKGNVVLNASTSMVPNAMVCSGDDQNIFSSTSRYALLSFIFHALFAVLSPISLIYLIIRVRCSQHIFN